MNMIRQHYLPVLFIILFFGSSMWLVLWTSPYRFVVLFFNCLLTFGSYFCFDMPSVLQNCFQSPPCNKTDNQTSHNHTCHEGGLGMTPNDYNLLYAIYAWTNAVVVIGAGFLIDKLGNRVGVFLFSSLVVLGSSLFAVGAMFPGSSLMLPLMLTGRLLFGAGNGSLTIVQNRITAFWFKNKELALAFGITLAFSRLGSVLNFLLTETFADHHGLQWTLWGGTVLCGLGFLSAILVSSLDKYGVQKLGEDTRMLAQSKKLKFTDIRHFTLQYWLLTIMIMFFYNGVFPFVADASDYIQDKYNYPPRKASYVAGAAYDVSMVMSPFLGGVIDIIGRRGVLALSCALLTIPVYGVLAFSHVIPLVCILWLGVTYSTAAASMWPSIPLVVSHSTVGTAMGITTSLQMIGIGVCNLVVGEILGNDYTKLDTDVKLRHWKYVMIFLLINTLCCAATGAVLNIVDRRKGGALNESRNQRRLREIRCALKAGSLPPPEYENPINTEGGGDRGEEPTETDPLLANRNNLRIN